MDKLIELGKQIKELEDKLQNTKLTADEELQLLLKIRRLRQQRALKLIK